MTSYKVARVKADVIIPAESISSVTSGTTNNLTDLQVNGLLKGIIITVPTFTDTATVTVSDNTTVTENVVKA